MNTTQLALTAYLQNVVGGVSMHELSRKEDVEVSTISRRVRRVEEMRDWPEWDALLDQLVLVTCPEGVTDEVVLTALSVTPQEAEEGFLAASPALSQRGATLAVTDAPIACVFLDGEVAHRTTKRLATAWLGLGWVKEHLNGKVRRYVPTGDFSFKTPFEPPQSVDKKRPAHKAERPSPRPYARYTTESSENIARMQQMRVGAHGSKFGFTPDQIDLAIDLSSLMAAAEVGPPGSAKLRKLIEIKERLGEDLFDILHDFLHAGHGFERIEKARGYPARSAKILLRVALDLVTHAGLDEGLSVLGEGEAPQRAPAMADGRSVRPVHAAE